MLTSDAVRRVFLQALFLATFLEPLLVVVGRSRSRFNNFDTQDAAIYRNRRSRLSILKSALANLEGNTEVHHSSRNIPDLLSSSGDYYDTKMEAKKSVGFYDVMSNVKYFFDLFYNVLQPFVKALPSEYNASAPSCLANVPVLAQLITPNAPAFTYNQGGIIFNRIVIIITSTRMMLEKTKSYVRPQYASSFSTTSRDLMMYADLLEINLQALKMSNGMDGVDVTAAGIGDINTGVNKDVKADVWEMLKALLICFGNMSGKK